MFTAALFTTGNICKQPNCPSADKWIKKMQYTRTHTHTHARAHTHTHTHGYYSATYSNMDGPKRTCCIYSTGNSTQYSVTAYMGKES